MQHFNLSDRGNDIPDLGLLLPVIATEIGSGVDFGEGLLPFDGLLQIFYWWEGFGQSQSLIPRSRLSSIAVAVAWTTRPVDLAEVLGFKIGFLFPRLLFGLLISGHLLEIGTMSIWTARSGILVFWARRLPYMYKFLIIPLTWLFLANFRGIFNFGSTNSGFSARIDQFDDIYPCFDVVDVIYPCFDLVDIIDPCFDIISDGNKAQSFDDNMAISIYVVVEKFKFRSMLPWIKSKYTPCSRRKVQITIHAVVGKLKFRTRVVVEKFKLQSMLSSIVVETIDIMYPFYRRLRRLIA